MTSESLIDTLARRIEHGSIDDIEAAMEEAAPHPECHQLIAPFLNHEALRLRIHSIRFLAGSPPWQARVAERLLDSEWVAAQLAARELMTSSCDPKLLLPAVFGTIRRVAYEVYLWLRQRAKTPLRELILEGLASEDMETRHRARRWVTEDSTALHTIGAEAVCGLLCIGRDDEDAKAENRAQKWLEMRHPALLVETFFSHLSHQDALYRLRAVVMLARNSAAHPRFAAMLDDSDFLVRRASALALVENALKGNGSDDLDGLVARASDPAILPVIGEVLWKRRDPRLGQLVTDPKVLMQAIEPSRREHSFSYRPWASLREYTNWLSSPALGLMVARMAIECDGAPKLVGRILGWAPNMARHIVNGHMMNGALEFEYETVHWPNVLSSHRDLRVQDLARVMRSYGPPWHPATLWLCGSSSSLSAALTHPTGDIRRMFWGHLPQVEGRTLIQAWCGLASLTVARRFGHGALSSRESFEKLAEQCGLFSRHHWLAYSRIHAMSHEEIHNRLAFIDFATLLRASELEPQDVRSLLVAWDEVEAGMGPLDVLTSQSTASAVRTLVNRTLRPENLESLAGPEKILLNRFLELFF